MRCANNKKFMKNSKNTWIILGIVAIIVIVAVAVQGKMSAVNSEQTSNKKQTVIIGITLPLTGDIAMLGESARNAILLADESLPKDLKYDYRLIFEDDQFKPSLGATVANKLISVDNADALISFGSPVGSVVSPIAEKAQILHVNDFASASHVADGEFNFVDYTPPYEDSKLFIQELQKRGIKKLVFFEQDDNQGAAAIIENFQNDIKKTHIKILSTQSFNTGTRDFRTEIDQVKSLNPDIYVLEATTPELEILTKQLRDSGIKTPVTTMEAFEFSDQLSLFEGMWYVNGADPMPWFVDMYTKAYGQSPKFGAANAYDVLNLVVKAVEKAGDGKTKPTRLKIKDALASISEFDGALGEHLTIDANGVVDSKAVVRMIKNGMPVTIAP